MSGIQGLQALIERMEEGDASGEEIELLRASISQVEALVEENWTQEFNLVFEVSTAISDCREEKEVVSLLAKNLLALLEAKTCAVYQWAPAENCLNLWCFYPPGVSGNGVNYPQPLPLDLFPLRQQVFRNAQPLHIFATDEQGAEKARLQALGVEALLIAPLGLPGRALGLIEVGGSSSGPGFRESRLSFAQILSNQSASAIERIRLLKEIERRSAELDAVHKASLSLTASLDLQEVLDTILENTLELLSDAQDAHIFLYDEEKLNFGAALWSGGHKGKAWANPRPGGLTYSVARGGEVINVPDMREHPLFKDTPPTWIGSIVGLPLKIGPRVVGVMTVADAKTNAFAERKLHVLRLLADQAAIAIENARLHDMVTRQARTDALTGLPNRRAFNERLNEEVRRSDRYQQALSLLMIDLTTFKHINDTYGHPVGDLVLKQVSACLRSSMRSSDFLARYGGDEFTVVLPKTDSKAAKWIARRLKDRVQSCQLEIPGREETSISLEIGIASYPAQARTVESLLKAADDNLYLVKEGGNSCQE